MKTEIKNHYFKHYADEPKMTFISGLPLPNADNNGIVRDVRFIGCSEPGRVTGPKRESFGQTWEPDKMSPGARRIIELSEQRGGK